MWKALAFVAAVSHAAYAADSLLDSETRVARDAARAGHCDVVVDVGHKIATDFPDYYEQTWLADSLLRRCMEPAPPAPVEVTPVDVSRSEVKPTPARDLPAPRVGAEIIVGGVAGAGGATLGFLVIGGLEGFCCLAGPLAAGLAGGTIGTALGVYLIGRTPETDASLGATLVGSALGTATGILCVNMVLGNGDNEGAALGCLLAGPLVGSLAGFHLSRGWRDGYVTPVATNNTVGLAGTF